MLVARILSCHASVKGQFVVSQCHLQPLHIRSGGRLLNKFSGGHARNSQQFSLRANKKPPDPPAPIANKGLRSFTVLAGGITSLLAGGLCGLTRSGIGVVKCSNEASNRLVGARYKTSSGDSSQDSSGKDQDHFDWGKFWILLKENIAYLVVAIGSAMAVAALNIRIPQLLGDLVNIVAQTFASNTSGLGREETAATGGNMANFLQEMRGPAMEMVKLYVGQAALTFAYIYSLACVGERMSVSLRRELFSSILQQDIAFFDEHNSGEIVSRLTSDIQDFKSSFKQCISMGLRTVSQTIGSSVVLYLISPEMAGATLVLMPVVVGCGTLFGSLLRRLSRRAQEQGARATAAGEECISNIRTVRAFAMEDLEMKMYTEEVEKSRESYEMLGLGIGLFQGGVNLFLNSVVLGTLYYGGYLMSEQRLTPGDLMSFLVATQTIQRSLGQMSLVFGQAIKGFSAGGRVFEYMNLEPSIPLHSGGKTIPFYSLFGDVEFRNVSFTYPTRPHQVVLDDLSLKIPAGHMVALVGSSGGGKSTVASLLERFYDCSSGGVYLDGINIKEFDPKWLRGKCIGYISQEPVLFATSVMENIRYGRPEATDQEIVEAAKSANAHKFISEFPQGYQTVLGERGVTLSGGQKQRVAIARALVKNPSLLVLDEATSALDAESEKVVQEALDSVCKGRTVLVIAHRLSTVKNANLIAVISKGKIAEMGTHEELKRKGGIYSYLIRQQEVLGAGA